MSTSTDAAQRFFARLYRQNEFAIKLGLQPMQQALNACRNPLAHTPIALIAGTNGKGSVAATLAALLQAYTRRVGLFTSPHLVDFGERIRINGQAMTLDALMQLGPTVLQTFGGDDAWDDPCPTLDALDPSMPLPARPLTYFELATLTAALAFAAASCDRVVLEVGLGGRLDATNAFEPSVGVITEIGLDHQQYLGDTVDAIALEKAGIMRPGVPVVIGSRTARQTLTDHAKAIGAPAYVLDDDFGWAWQRDDVACFSGFDQRFEVPVGHTSLDFQRDNLANAIAAAVLLEHDPLDAATAARGIRAMRWPGRMMPLPTEVSARRASQLGLAHTPNVLLDAAHNPMGADALAKVLRAQYDGVSIVMVIGIMADKDIEAMTTIWHSLDTLSEVIVVPITSARACDPVALCARAGWPVSCAAATLNDGLDRAWRQVAHDGMVVIAGSIYLLGDVLRALDATELAQRTYVPSQP